MKLVSGIVDSGFFAQSALSAEVATKDSLGRNISETYLTGVDLTPYQTTAGMTAYANSAEVTGTAQYGLTTAGWSEITGGGVTGDYELSAGSGISIVDYPLEQKTVISVTAQGGNPEVEQVVIDNSATWDSVTAKLDTTAFSDVSGTFLTAHQDLSDYQTTAGMTAYLTTGDSAEFMTTAERSDYIPTGVSSEFYTTANTANYISEVPDTYLQNTDLSTEDGKVTAISGIPLSAGGDVPEGVMVESGLEYNAVNEISGYNGSAIAQYGAEKQFIVHDDTLVHLSNSAQYALGVNLSAVAQLLGIDETVLWEGNMPMTSGSTARCSESIYNFNKIKFLYNVSADNEYQQNSNYTVETDQTSASNRISWGDGFTIGNNWYNRYFNRFTITNGTDLTLTNATCYWGQTAQGGYSLTRHPGSFYKIIGIGRKV